MYGVLHCNSLISPYRLEMGLSVLTYEAKNLYTFWKNRITIYLEMYCKRSELNAIINCASGEYAKTIDFSQLSIPVITCDFREMKNGVPKSVSSFAKQARGLMARWIIIHKLSGIEELKKFTANGYYFSEKLSSPTQFNFIRD